VKITIPHSEYTIKAVRSGGAGGQHVNKVSSRIELYWNFRNSELLTDDQKDRIAEKMQSRISDDGLLRVTEDSSRSQHGNREAIVKKLHKLIAAALKVNKKRVPTKISAAAKRKRVDSKKKRAEVKSLRRKISD
jgi:ribosome-associated protein